MVAHWSIPLSTSLLLLASGCASSPPEQPASAALAPVAQPVMVAGTRVTEWDHLAGKERSWTVESVSADGAYTALRDDGCGWTETLVGIGPALAWNNCPSDSPEWRSGTNTITAHDGALFPLAVGNSESWTVTSRSASGKSSTDRRTCTVASTVRVATRSGERDAFKIVCDGTWQTRTALVGGDGKLIRSSEANKQKVVEWDNETLAIELPST